MKAHRLLGLSPCGAIAVALLGACGGCSSNPSGSNNGGGSSSGGGVDSGASVSGNPTSEGAMSGAGGSSGSGASGSGGGGPAGSGSPGSAGSSAGNVDGGGTTATAGVSTGGSTSGGGAPSGSGSGGTAGGTGTSGATGTAGGSSGAGGTSAMGGNGVIGSCAPSEVTDKTCLPPEPAIPTGCAMVAAPRTVMPAAEGGTSTLVAESATETLDNALIVAGFASHPCVELTTGGSGANAFLIGQLKLTSGQTLVVDTGVTVYASRNPKSYGAACVVIDPSGAVSDTSAPGDAQYDCGGVIMVTGDSVAIMGGGVIDGQGGEPLIGVTPPTKDIDTVANPTIPTGSFSWWNVSDFQRHDSRAQGSGPGSAPNPALVRVDMASNFVLYKIHLYNSPFFHVAVNSDKFVIWGIDIHTPFTATSSAGQMLSNYVARNTDGIDPGAATGVTQDGYIVGTTVSTGDDMVAIKGSAQGGANNIVVAHNHFGTGHGMSLGSAAIQGITNLHVYDLTIDGDVPVDPLTGGSDLNGLRVKSYTGAGGPVKNILFEDVCTRDEAYPIDITASYDANPIVDPAGVAPDFENITVQNFHQVDVNGPQHATEVTVDVEGDTTHNATVTFSNVWVETSHGKKGGPVLTVASTATLTGTMNIGVPPAGSDACTGKTFWPAPPTIP